MLKLVNIRSMEFFFLFVSKRDKKSCVNFLNFLVFYRGIFNKSKIFFKKCKVRYLKICNYFFSFFY